MDDCDCTTCKTDRYVAELEAEVGQLRKLNQRAGVEILDKEGQLIKRECEIKQLRETLDKQLRAAGETSSVVRDYRAEVARLILVESGRHEANVQRVLDAGLSTGHVGTSEELILELLDQIEDFRGRINEAKQQFGVSQCEKQS